MKQAKAILEIAFFFFIASLFLLLGSDFPEPLRVRLWGGGMIAFSFLIFSYRENRFLSFWNLTAIFFLSFVIFEILRAGWAGGQILLKGHPTAALLQYLSSPFRWCFGLMFFTTGFLMFQSRSSAHRLLWVLMLSGFFLSLNALPTLLRKGYAAYQIGLRYVFFHPSFYSHEIARRYVFGEFANVNYTGDVIALGFFPALGLSAYFLHTLPEKGKRGRAQASFLSLGIPAVIAGATALAALAFYSRGTMISFGLVLLFFLVAMGIRFFSRQQLLFSLLALGIVLAFVFWAGNAGKALKELQTVNSEWNDAEGIRSFSVNREGARRSLEIYKTHPLWGAGTGGYEKVSWQFASSGTEDSAVNQVAYSHYFQLLAEEGAGAFLYYLFILSYFFEGLRGLWKTRSRFQFMSALSLFAAVSMVMIHASIGVLMERFSLSMLIYILMGANLAVLNKDFGHE